MGKYIRIDACDGIVRVLEGDGESPSLELMQGVVGGYIECVFAKRLPNNVDMFCNEEGKIDGLATNFSATSLLGYDDDTISGNVILVGRDGCESRWLTDDEVNAVMEVLK